MIRKDRIPVLIGKDGKTKEMIENLTGTEITIDSQSGAYFIKPKADTGESEEVPQVADGLQKWNAERVIKAIGRGFNPKKAIKLIEDDYILEIIDLERVLGNSKKRLRRMKGRLIGEAGKMRRMIEDLSGSHLSILGNSVAIIATFEGLKITRKALNMLLSGAPHKVVASFLRRKNRERKEREARELWRPVF